MVTAQSDWESDVVVAATVFLFVELESLLFFSEILFGLLINTVLVDCDSLCHLTGE